MLNQISIGINILKNHVLPIMLNDSYKSYFMIKSVHEVERISRGLMISIKLGHSHPNRACAILIVRLKRNQAVISQVGEGINEMGTQVGVDVLRHKLAESRSVLRPVGMVTHSPLARSAASWD